jgi:sortase A
MQIPQKYNSRLKFFAGVGLLALFLALVLDGEYAYKVLRYKISPQTSGSSISTIAEEQGQPNHLWISSINVDAPIIYVEAANENAFQKALQSGVVHFPGTASIGEAGNAYIFGHSSDYIYTAGHYKTVFALLPKVNVGAEVQISNALGQIFTYEIIEKKIVVSDDMTVLDQNTNGQKLLSLQTSYPVGTALKRYVVIAELKQ